LGLDCRGFSHKGPVRSINEDSYRSADLPGAVFLEVADGLGGEAAGEHASRIAVESMLGFLQSSWISDSLEDPEDLLRRAAIRAHLDIVSDGRRDGGRGGMATTLTAALVVWPTAYIVHAGDSRAYRLRDGALQRLTTDHTVEQQLRERGVLQAPSLRYRNILVNHLGGDDRFPELQMARVELDLGDSLLLATDGLTDALPDADLASLASGGESAEAVCRKLVQAARERGSTDDATALLARFLFGK